MYKYVICINTRRNSSCATVHLHLRDRTESYVNQRKTGASTSSRNSGATRLCFSTKTRKSKKILGGAVLAEKLLNQMMPLALPLCLAQLPDFLRDVTNLDHKPPPNVERVHLSELNPNRRDARFKMKLMN